MKRFITGMCAVTLMLSLAACGGGGSGIEGWPTSGLAEEIPAPPEGTLEQVDYDDERLSASVEEVSADAFNAYVDSCENAGFTEEANQNSSRYEAYSEDGYKLSVMYWDSNETMDITLEAPIAMEEIAWPTAGAGSLVPAPDSTMGLIDSDSSTFFYAYVEMDEEAFGSYIDACAEAGFTVDYDRGDTWYYADDAAGNDLSLNYQGFNVATVRVQAADPDDAASEADPSTSGSDASTGSGATDASGVSPDFKATMDEYEAFFNEYCDFMESYSQNPSDPMLIAEYASMMSQYSDTMAALEAIDESSLSAADSAYYLEVQTRINQRLLEVGESLS